MVMPDVNILVAAHRPEHPDHAQISAWLTAAVNATEPLGLSLAVATGYIRIATNRRIFPNDPTPPDVAVGQIDALLNSGGVLLIDPSPATWARTRRLITEASARGNLVPDATHAALAIEHHATWVTLDLDFARFPGLRWSSQN